MPPATRPELTTLPPTPPAAAPAPRLHLLPQGFDWVVASLLPASLRAH